MRVIAVLVKMRPVAQPSRVAPAMKRIRFVIASVAVSAVALSLARPDAVADGVPMPARLHDTGLYATGSGTDIAPGVAPFSPQYPLWSDGASKRRWIYLPPDTAIDARDPDAWEFPVGTRLWKEFSMGRRVETRMIERVADGSWRFMAFVWDDGGEQAMLAPAGGIAALPVATAPGGRYTIPSQYDCLACHDDQAPVLGFSALQLSPDRDPLAPHAETPPAGALDLPAVVDQGLLVNLSAALLARPPRIDAVSPEERAVLGYLHGNCGHCHAAPGTSEAAVPVDVRMAQRVGEAASAARVRDSLIHMSARYRPAGVADGAVLVKPGNARDSILYLRMSSRDPRVQMPPLGTALPDSDALSLIARWIDLQP